MYYPLVVIDSKEEKIMAYELLTIREVTQMLRVNVSTIYRLLREGKIPSPTRVGPSATRCRASELRDWLDNRPRTTDSPHSGPAQAA